MNHNLTCNLQKISGEITNFGGKFDREVDLSNTLLNVTENEDGFGNGYQPKYQKITYDETTKTHSYVFLVEPGVYKMQGECAYSQKFTVPSKMFRTCQLILKHIVFVSILQIQVVLSIV